MFDKDNKFGFIISNNENSNNIKNTDLPCTISSKVLATVPASNINLDDEITINNVSFNKDRKYYIEFLGVKKLCNLSISEITEISCIISNYVIQGITFSSDLIIYIGKINEDDTTTDTFTDLVIYEEEIKCLDNKYIENNLIIQNSISLGRIGDIGVGSSAVGNGVTASGMFSHAEGYITEASGNFSHAEGGSTEAIGDTSHAEGYWTKASSDYQHVQGKCNIEDTEGKYAHIVGNGKDGSNRSNAHTLDWEGNAWYSGKLSQEGTPTEDKDLTTKKYVDDKVEQILPEANISANDVLGRNKNGELIWKEIPNLTCLQSMDKTKPTILSELSSGIYYIFGYAKILKNSTSEIIDYQNYYGLTYINGYTIENIKYMTIDTHIRKFGETLPVFYYITFNKDLTGEPTIEKRLYPTSDKILEKNNTQEYTPTENYHPTTKKYVDDKVSSLPQLSFNENGELVVKIGDTTKIFVPKNEQ